MLCGVRLTFALKRGPSLMGYNQYQAKRWQKVIHPPEDELERESDRPGWIRKYLELADLLIQRVQRRAELGHYKKSENRRHAA